MLMLFVSSNVNSWRNLLKIETCFVWIIALGFLILFGEIKISLVLNFQVWLFLTIPFQDRLWPLINVLLDRSIFHLGILIGISICYWWRNVCLKCLRMTGGFNVFTQRIVNLLHDEVIWIERCIQCRAQVRINLGI